jgi:oligosaccharyltransferase complex subunit epsilon
MAPKKNSASTVNTPAPSAPSAPATTVASAPSKASASSNNPFTIFGKVYQNYTSSTAQRTKLIDAFLGFLVITGVLQFAYCVIAGNYVCRVSS